MSHLAPLISDLALILICAGLITLLFKKLKQPLVLGYIVAGFVASPHFSLTPSVTDVANIQTWSEIGVIFLLFALGLEFSFKKLMRVGGPAVISACTIILSMICLGTLVGWLFGWKQMDCIYLGGMLAMSSTTIIYKAFDDMGIRQQRFAGLVLSILIIEDILAIVLMVMLSTMAVSQNFEGGEMIYSLMKLIFFLVLWFVVGIYVVPLFLKRYRSLMGNETMLIVALGFCFGMVVLAAKVGFSPAFGAFIMGSILAETIESEKIEKLVAPVKDLFGAIFFVSVGMMVDPEMIVAYRYPILCIVLAILFGQTVFGTAGVLLSGQPLKTAMQCGFSLTQIGEFAFIIASLGVSLGVTSPFLYPIVVAVSVITTFLTPYMIRLALPAYRLADCHLPLRWRRLLERYSSGGQNVSHSNNWRKLLEAVIRITVICSVMTIAVTLCCLHVLLPFLVSHLGDWAGRLAGALITIAAVSPFLRALIMKKNRSLEFRALWADSRFNHAPLISVILLRVIIAIVFLMFILGQIFQASAALGGGVAVLIVGVMIFSRFLKKQSILLERTFVQNLRSKEMRQEFLGVKPPEYAGKLLDRDLHLSDFTIPAESAWAGKTLKELNLGNRFEVHVASIIRGRSRLNIPDGHSRLFPNDTIQVIGTDEQLARFSAEVDRVSVPLLDEEEFEKYEMSLCQFAIGESSSLVGTTLETSGIRSHYHCLVVGVEAAEDHLLHTPETNMQLKRGDVIWVVGEEANWERLRQAVQ